MVSDSELAGLLGKSPLKPHGHRAAERGGQEALGLFGRGFVTQEAGGEGVQGSPARMPSCLQGTDTRAGLQATCVLAFHPASRCSLLGISRACSCALQLFHPVAVTETIIWGFEKLRAEIVMEGKLTGKRGTGTHYERGWLSAFLGKGELAGVHEFRAK